MRVFKAFIYSSVCLFLLVELSACGVKQTTSGKQPFQSTPSANASQPAQSQGQSSAGNTSKKNTTPILYNTYHNQRFGFSLPYPASWKESPRATDGDGRSFTTPSHVPSFNNGSQSGTSQSGVLLKAVGAANSVYGASVGQTFNQMIQAIEKSVSVSKQQPNVISATYKVVPNKGIWTTTIRKVKNGQDAINFQKQYTDLKSVQTISLTYPESQKQTYQPIIQHIVSQFKIGEPQTSSGTGSKQNSTQNSNQNSTQNASQNSIKSPTQNATQSGKNGDQQSSFGNQSKQNSTGTSASSQPLTLENITYLKTGVLFVLTHGNMKQAYADPHITSGNPKKFVVTLKNVSHGKYALNQQIAVNQGWAQTFNITKNGSDLVLTFTIKTNDQTNIGQIQPGLGGGFELTFNFLKFPQQPEAPVMPNLPNWNSLSQKQLTINTSYGEVHFSSLNLTKQDVTVSLNSGGTKHILYSIHQPSFKKVYGWQLDGRYLLLKFGFPPNAHPTTGDFGYQIIAIDLKAKYVVLNQPSTVQSKYYLTQSYFANSFIKTVNGIPDTFVHVVNLVSQQQALFKLPENVIGLGVLSGNTLYYKINQKVFSTPLPTKGWQSLNKTITSPIQIKVSNGASKPPSFEPLNYSSQQKAQIKKVAKQVGVHPVVATKGLSDDHLTIIKNGGKGTLILDYVNFWVIESNQPLSYPTAPYQVQQLDLGNGLTANYVSESSHQSAFLYFKRNGEYLNISELKSVLSPQVAKEIGQSFSSID